MTVQSNGVRLTINATGATVSISKYNEAGEYVTYTDSYANALENQMIGPVELNTAQAEFLEGQQETVNVLLCNSEVCDPFGADPQDRQGAAKQAAACMDLMFAALRDNRHAEDF